MSTLAANRDVNFQETALCLGMPGGKGCEMEEGQKSTGKRSYQESIIDLKLNLQVLQSVNRVNHLVDLNEDATNIKEKKLVPPGVKEPPTKAQVVGWPPVRSYRKNVTAPKSSGPPEGEKAISSGSLATAFVKVCMDGAPYLRKVDLKMHKSYQELSDALAKLFSNSFAMGNYNGAQGMIDFMNESKLMDLLHSSEYVPTYEDKDGDWMLVGDVPWQMFVDSCKRLRIMKGSDAIGLAPRAMEKCKTRS